MKFSIRLALLASALIWAAASTAFAAPGSGGVVYVMRPPVPGKSAGVLPQKAFVVEPTTPGSSDGNGDNGSDVYDFKSADFDRESGPIRHVTLRIRKGFETPERLIIRTPQAPLDLVCGVQDARGNPYVFANNYLYWSNNVNGIMVQAITPGRFAALIECSSQEHDSEYTYWHAEKVVITVPDT